MRKLPGDSIRPNARGDPTLPLVSTRQEILTSLVSALDSVVGSQRLDRMFDHGCLIQCGEKMIKCTELMKRISKQPHCVSKSLNTSCLWEHIVITSVDEIK